MRSRDARRLAIDHLEEEGWVVFERRIQFGHPALGQIVIADPDNGGTQLVRVMTGKRPKDSDRLFIDRAREGRCDLLAMVDPRDGSVRLEIPSSIVEAVSAA